MKFDEDRYQLEIKQMKEEHELKLALLAKQMKKVELEMTLVKNLYDLNLSTIKEEHELKIKAVSQNNDE